MGKRKHGKNILAVLPPYEERERKYIPRVPGDVRAQGEQAVADYKKARLLAIVDYIRNNKDIFVTLDDPAFAPALPPSVPDSFRPPEEYTKPRERIYFVDPALKVRDLKAEFRQETGKSYGVKQTVKLDNGSRDGDPTLDRIELPAKLSRLGIKLKAVANDEDRKRLKRHFRNKELKPAFRMVSQRIRMSYHPEGDPDVEIEAACDAILVGETVFGRVWQDPKLEIEIKKGSDDPALANQILDREEQRLMTLFDLERQFESNGTIGYRNLEDDLKTAAGQQRIKDMKPDERWWLKRQPELS